MNCNEYLGLLTTLPLDDLSYGQAREHALTCADCDRITRAVAARERNMRLAFGDLRSSTMAGEVAAQSLETSRRRRVARYFEAALGVAMVAFLAGFVMLRRGPVPVLVPDRAAVMTETFQLQCLSPEQAANVVRPYISPGSAIIIPPVIPSMIRVQGSPAEIERVRSMIDQWDNAQVSTCATLPRRPLAR
jgi:type II secretory pathway component GspD/PulD (secretin)